MLKDQDEFYGWISAIIATIAFGSFVVPMKGEAATRVDVDPLVFQSYKSFMCFFLSWFLVLFGIKPTFTPWGIVSAAFWVPGSTAGIYAVRRAGLAVSVAIWSTAIVVVSFVWGVIIFHEGVRTVSGAVGAALVLCIGLWGISFFSAPAKVGHHHPQVESSDNKESSHGRISMGKEDANYGALDLENTNSDDSKSLSVGETKVEFMGVHVMQYHLGILMAFVNGFLAATIMVPLHYAG
mmetsp:Transcript_31761/g.46705  ORF Transcript_31761/g.46705 Transcript_31761/m.46705 type:complete len:238 (-) Transcript_31761:1372-2085(-)